MVIRYNEIEKKRKVFKEINEGINYFENTTTTEGV